MRHYQSTLIILDWMREFKKDGSAEKRKHAEESLLREEQIDTAEKTAPLMEENGAASLVVKRTKLGKNEENASMADEDLYFAPSDNEYLLEAVSYVEQKITCKNWDISGKWNLQSVNTRELLVPATMEIHRYGNPTQIFGRIDSSQFGGTLRCSKALEIDYHSDASSESDSSGPYDEFDIGDNDLPTGNEPRLFFRFFGFDIKARAIVAGGQGEETCTLRFSAEGKKVEICLWHPETYCGGDVERKIGGKMYRFAGSRVVDHRFELPAQSAAAHAELRTELDDAHIVAHESRMEEEQRMEKDEAEDYYDDLLRISQENAVWRRRRRRRSRWWLKAD